MKSSGFTLIESILFITLLALLATGLVSLFARHLVLFPHTSQMLPALLLADGKLASLMADYHDPDKGMNWLVDGNYGEESLAEGYRRVVAITSVQVAGDSYQCSDTPASGTDTIKCLTVRVAALENPLLTVQSRTLVWRASP
ncbi:MAG: hypothetical protein G8345_13185 [Magnetococcales bacterium]|nr:hypothetical protein [Magnetococcales bacterium]NGZ27827.1 hypothetical protein [Magnetococcales bacterium]